MVAWTIRSSSSADRTALGEQRRSSAGRAGPDALWARAARSTAYGEYPNGERIPLDAHIRARQPADTDPAQRLPGAATLQPWSTARGCSTRGPFFVAFSTT
jgi:hypothetical protein